MRESKQVVVVRRDLNMRKGKMAAQVAHASLGAILKLMDKSKVNQGRNLMLYGFLESDTPEYQWITESFTKICVSCDSEHELLDLVEKADKAGILTCAITDSGKTEFNNVPTLTCAAFGPAWDDAIRQITGHLKLL